MPSSLLTGLCRPVDHELAINNLNLPLDRTVEKMEPNGASMSVEEFAALEIAGGLKIQKHGDIWWRRVRPFFYRPLLPYRELIHEKMTCPPLSHIGGVQHIVPTNEYSNSVLDLLLFENPQAYSLDALSQTGRRRVRRAMKIFNVRMIDDLDHFISCAYPVYLSFYERTKYSYKNERTARPQFAAWAQNLFRFPKVRVFGVYRGNELKSVGVSYDVEDVGFLATFFSETDALSDFVSDFILHCIRERMATSSNLKFIFAGIGSRPRGLDEFYLLRGASWVRKQARLRMNPLASVSLKVFCPQKYAMLHASA